MLNTVEGSNGGKGLYFGKRAKVRFMYFIFFNGVISDATFPVCGYGDESSLDRFGDCCFSRQESLIIYDKSSEVVNYIKKTRTTFQDHLICRMTEPNTDLDYECLPYVKVYKSGHVERLMYTDSLPARTDPKTGVSSKDVPNIIPETEVYVRIYLPKLKTSNEKLPLVVYFHGGAFILCTPSTTQYHNYLNALVSEAHVIAVSVHYRRAPEHPLPMAYEDSWAALQWVASHVNADGPEPLLNVHADFRRVFLSGDSAGANIVHNLAMAAGSCEPGLNLEMLGIALIDPYFWGTDPLGSEMLDPEAKAHVDKLWPFVCPSCPSCDDPWINPVGADAPSLAELACHRVLICVAEKDILKDRGSIYFQVLGRSGWMGMVEIHESDGSGHCFHLAELSGEKAKERMAKMVHFFNRDAP